MSEIRCFCGAEVDKPTYCIDCYNALEKRVMVLERALEKSINCFTELPKSGQYPEDFITQATDELRKEGKI